MKIAVLDDDKTSLQLIEQALMGGDDEWSKTVRCSFFSDGKALMSALTQESFDALILDRQVPGMSGDEVMAWIRANLPPQTVIIMVTSLAGVSESSVLLSNGADDYITKPFNSVDLLARTKRLLTRAQQSLAVVNKVRVDSGTFSMLGFVFNRAACTVRWDDHVVVCSEREFELAVFLCSHAGRPLSREALYEAVYHRRFVNSSRALDALVHRVRMKLQLNEQHGFVVQPIYGFGYRLDVLAGVA